MCKELSMTIEKREITISRKPKLTLDEKLLALAKAKILANIIKADEKAKEFKA